VDARDAGTVAELREGGDGWFESFVDRWYGSTVRFARPLAGDDATARRAARDAWLSVIGRLRDLDDALPLHLVVLRATLEALAARPAADASGAAVAPDAFEAEGHRWAGWWRDDTSPEDWEQPPADKALARALDALDPATAAVVTLRDVEELSAEDVEAVLELTPSDQRALLNRGRASVWQTLAEADA
jgi:DNA-directed RNA polymerase specialized sigma24 family protein